jgi:hypothetical protein
MPTRKERQQCILEYLRRHAMTAKQLARATSINLYTLYRDLHELNAGARIRREWIEHVGYWFPRRARSISRSLARSYRSPGPLKLKAISLEPSIHLDLMHGVRLNWSRRARSRSVAPPRETRHP